MADLDQIKGVAERTDNWLANRQAIHIKRMATAVEDLQSKIINSMAELSVKKGGGLASLRLNSKRLQNVYKDVIMAFDNDFNGAARTVINDFKSVENQIQKSYKDLDEAMQFSGADKASMDVLKESAYAEYVAIGGAAQEKVIQSLYSSVMGGKDFSELVTDIEGILVGSVARNGRPLINYAKLYANDMIMNFHNDVTLKKGTDIGMDQFLYYGTLIASSRDFCKRRVGQTYTKKQIDSWKGPWKGKRGDAWTYRGGWNCRHHWQPVRKKWLEKYDPVEMQSYFAETGKALPKQVKPWGADSKSKATKPKTGSKIAKSESGSKPAKPMTDKQLDKLEKKYKEGGGVFFDRETIQRKHIAKQIRNNDVESFYVIGDDGKVLLTKTGDERTITFSSSDMDKMKYNTVIHNHPTQKPGNPMRKAGDGGSFSPGDIEAFFEAKISKLYAFSEKYDFLLSEGFGAHNVKNKASKVIAQWTKIRDRKLKEFRKSIGNLDAVLEQADREVWHEIMEETAGKFKWLNYSREVAK